MALTCLTTASPVAINLPLTSPQNGALIALSKHCPRLVSLNVALVGRVTDSGVSALSRGCPSLQALNIAGAKEASVLQTSRPQNAETWSKVLYRTQALLMCRSRAGPSKLTVYGYHG